MCGLTTEAQSGPGPVGGVRVHLAVREICSIDILFTFFLKCVAKPNYRSDLAENVYPTNLIKLLLDTSSVEYDEIVQLQITFSGQPYVV